MNVSSSLVCGFNAALLIGLTALPSQAAGGYASEFSVSGEVVHPSAFDTAGLAALALPPLTESVTYGTKNGPVSATYTGVSMWSLLNSPAVGLKPDPSVAKNDVLGKVVVATGSDGYRVVYSGGELSPSFGGSKNVDMIATADANGPLTTDGAFRTVAPGDAKGGRHVSNLKSLAVLNTPTALSTVGGTSNSFSVTGGVVHGGTFDLAAITGLGLPVIDETVTYLSGSTSVTASFSGVSLWSFVSTLGIVTDAAVKNDLLSKYLVVTASDGYKAAFSMGELSPDLGGNTGAPDLIAFSENGKPLGSDGAFRIVVPGDVNGGRYVSNIVGIEVLGVAAVPEPATAALMAAGLFAALMCAPRWARLRRPKRIV